MNGAGPDRPAIHPLLLLAIGIVGSVFWCFLFQGLAAVLPIADALIGRIAR